MNQLAIAGVMRSKDVTSPFWTSKQLNTSGSSRRQYVRGRRGYIRVDWGGGVYRLRLYLRLRWVGQLVGGLES